MIADLDELDRLALLMQDIDVPLTPAEELQQLLQRPRWHGRAACRGMGPDLFFPGVGDQKVADEAKSVCAGCPVRGECADFAAMQDRSYLHGIWAGTSGGDRRREAASAPRRVADHGTRSKYTNGCRCEPCSHAASAYMRRYKAGRKAS